jgi:hypothetical protein
MTVKTPIRTRFGCLMTVPPVIRSRQMRAGNVHDQRGSDTFQFDDRPGEVRRTSADRHRHPRALRA